MAGNSLGALFYEIEARTEKLESGLGAAERRLQRFAGVIQRAPAAALGAFAAAAALVALQVARMADQIEQKMRRVGAILGATTEQMSKLRSAVVAMSREVPHSADVLAAGLEKIVALGERDPAKAINLLREASRGATVTGQDLNTVIEQLDQILDSFEGRRAPEVLDLLARAGQQGAPAADIAKVVASLGPSAAAASVPLEELVASVTTLLDKGLSSEQATTVLRRGLGGVVVDAKNADLMMNRLGGEIEVTNGHLVLGGRFAGEYQEKLAGLGSAAGTAARIERELNESLEAQVALLKDKLNAALLDLGTNTLPLVITLVRAFNGAMDTLNGTISTIRADSAIATIRSLAFTIGNLTGEARETAIRRLADAVANFSGRVGRAVRASTEDLQLLLAGLRAVGDINLATTLRRREVETELGRRGAPLVPQRGAGITPIEVSARAAPPPTEELIQRQRALAGELRAAVAALETGLVERARRALDEFAASVRELGRAATDGMRADLASLQQDFVQLQVAADFTQALEANERAIEQMTSAAKVGTTDWEEQRNILGSIREALARNLAEAREGTAEYERINGLHQRATGLLERMADAEERKAGAVRRTVRSREQENQLLAEQARRIEQGARGAIQLAEAFGLVDDNAARALQSIAQIAAALPGALSRDFTSLLSVGGGLAGLIGSLFGGGESPEEKARKEAMLKNTEAIERLAAEMGEFGLEITGTQFAGVLRAARAGATSPSERIGFRGALPGQQMPFEIQHAGDLSGALRALGLSMRDLRQVADELGISFAGAVPTVEELRVLLQAMAETDLTRFAETFTGQLEALRAEFELFDISDPIAQLERLRDVMSDPNFGAPALREALAGLDLSTAEGRAEAERRIQALFQQMQAGTLTAAQLGGLTAEQLLQALLNLEQTIDAANAATGTSTSFAVNRSITEVTGSRIGALLTSDVFWNQQTAFNTKLITEILSGGRHGPLLPPTVGELDRFNGGGLTINVVVNLHGLNGDASDVGAEIGQAVAAEIDRELGKRWRAYERAQGRVGLN